MTRLAAEPQTDNGPPTDEITRLHKLGFCLLPLGGGVDSKGPLCKFANRLPLDLKQILGPMHGRHSRAYGIRLACMIVVDVDEDTPEALAYIECRFGSSPVQVKTPRGRHYYYRNGAPVPNDLRQSGFAIDIKRGANSYVLGPYSVRPDGGIYEPVDGILGVTELPVFEDRYVPVGSRLADDDNGQGQGAVQVGGRNKRLYEVAISNVGKIGSHEALVECLKTVRDTDCEDPGSISDTEVEKIANWVWTLRLENRVFGKQHSGFYMQRDTSRHILSQPRGAPAWALFTIIQREHGHIPGKKFILDYNGMKNADLLPFGRSTFRQARDTLIDNELLRKVGGYTPGKKCQHYQIGRFCVSSH